MATALKKSSGREVWAMLLDESTVIVGDGSTTTLAAGHLYAIKSKKSAGSALPAGLGEGDVLFGQTGVTVTLAVGDDVYDLGDPFDTSKLIGFARSKDITRTKNTIDMTVDGDIGNGVVDQRIDPLVSVSGNINGLKVNGLPATAASRKIDAMFAKQIIQAADGTFTTLDKSDAIVIVALVYINKLRADNSVDIDIVPCVFTSNGDSTDYGSATSKSTAFTGVAKSQNGILPCTISAILPSGV